MVLGACVEGLMLAEEERRLTGCSIDFHRLRDSTSPSLPSSGVRGEGEDVVVVEQEIGLFESLESQPAIVPSEGATEDPLWGTVSSSSYSSSASSSSMWPHHS